MLRPFRFEGDASMRRFLFLPWLSVSLVLLLAYARASAQSSSLPIQTLTLGVRDQQGLFVGNIQPEQVAVKGLLASIESLQLDNAPRRILLLLDASGTMGERKTMSWSNVMQFAVRFTLQRKGDDSIGLDAYAEKDEILSPFTRDSQFLVRQAERYAGSGKGRKMLGYALAEVLSRQENGLRFGDVIVLVSSGERSDADKSDFIQIRDELIRKGIRICLVRVPSVLERGALKEVTDISKFVKECGGIELNMTSPMQNVEFGIGVRLDLGAIESTATAAYDFARTYYRLGLKILKPSFKLQKVHLEIVGQQKERMNGLQLNYPAYLVPPTM